MDKARIESIPQALRDLPQWVVWRGVVREDKLTKVPYSANTDELASTKDPSTWTSFDVALLAAHKYDGLGFVFSESDEFCGVDLDHCREGENKSRAFEILERFRETYIEFSPSGDGYHILCRGKPPRPGKGTVHKWV
jgi:putative DNA primase/helicase